MTGEQYLVEWVLNLLKPRRIDMRMFSKVLLASTLVLGLLFPLAAPQPARAEVEYGYLVALLRL